jgi:hypothetical protein
MVTEKIQNLFKFIDFLHSNIKVYESLNPKIDQYYNLCKEKNKYYNKGYHEQKKYDKLQVEVNKVRDAIKNETVLKIINKANNLGLHFNDDIFSIDFDEIQKLKKIAVDEDLEIIELHKLKYLEFRKKSTKVVSFFQVWTFEDLDEDLLRLFEYFSKNQKEFDFLKTKIVPNKQETTKQKPQPVQQVFTSNSNNEISQSVYKNLQNFQFFQIEVIADMKFEGEVYKNVKQRNNNSILNTENWEQHKVVFFKQRMETYKDSYTLEEKVDLELETLEKLPKKSEDYKILKDRYKKYLKALLSQPTTNQKPVFNENGIEQNKVNFTNNFDAADEDEIYRYFYDKLVKKKMLTQAELNEFLISAFQENTPPKKRFKLKNVLTKGKVISIFYEYFKEIAQRPHGKQEQYASLLGEYFEGYKTSTIKTNFSK